MASTYNSVTVDTSADLILDYNKNRSGLVIKNIGNVIVYIGFNSSVTSANGIPISPQDTFTLMGSNIFKTTIYGIAASASADIRYFEWAL